jgi:hypothetical protein
MNLKEYIQVLQQFADEHPEAAKLPVWGYNLYGFSLLDPKPELCNLSILGRRAYKNRPWYSHHPQEWKGEAIVKI